MLAGNKLWIAVVDRSALQVPVQTACVLPLRRDHGFRTSSRLTKHNVPHHTPSYCVQSAQHGPMSTVVGLVKSRLRSRSRREKSIDGVDVVVDDGNGLVRYRSLRQEALADPIMDDVSALSPAITQPRTPNGLDPAALAEGLQGVTVAESVPPVPSLPADLPKEFFPARQSSLQSRRQYAIRAHRRASSSTKDDGLRLSGLPENGQRRRHYTISSPEERPPFDTDDYFQALPQHTPLSPLEIAPDHPAESTDMPATLTAKIFGSIAKKRRSIDLRTEPGQRTSQGSSYSIDHDSGHGSVQTSAAYPSRPRAKTYEEPQSPMRQDIEKPAPLQINKTTDTELPDHVRLPAGFELVNKQETVVDTVWHPAVEQETVHINRTEINHPLVERDVHVHHYYEYEQPIAVTEVLPMKHYQLDPKTGEKTEIDAPAGWQPPDSFATTVPDTSQIRGTQRHYVVDREHPNGELEDVVFLEQQAATTWI